MPEPPKQPQEESGPGWNVKRIPQPDGTSKIVTSYDLPLVSNAAATLLQGTPSEIKPHLLQAQPRVSYALLLLVLAIYGAGVAIALLDSGAASNDFFLKLALMKPKVITGEYYRCANSELRADLGHAPYCNADVSLGCYRLPSVVVNCV